MPQTASPVHALCEVERALNVKYLFVIICLFSGLLDCSSGKHDVRIQIDGIVMMIPSTTQPPPSSSSIPPFPRYCLSLHRSNLISSSSSRFKGCPLAYRRPRLFSAHRPKQTAKTEMSNGRCGRNWELNIAHRCCTELFFFFFLFSFFLRERVRQADIAFVRFWITSVTARGHLRTNKRDRQRHRHTETEREKETDRQTETERDRDTERERDKQRGRQTDVQTLLRSQRACNEMQASARTCGRRAADSMIENVG